MSETYVSIMVFHRALWLVVRPITGIVWTPKLQPSGGGYNENCRTAWPMKIFHNKYFKLISISGILILAYGLLFQVKPFAAETTADVPSKLSRAAELKARYADRPSLELYEKVLTVEPDNRDALWNAAYLHIRLGWLDKVSSSRRKHFEKAYGYARRVFRRCPDCYDAHLIMGAAEAKLAEFLGPGKKVRTARELEKHARFLLDKRSDNPDVWYIFGWWNFELARVSFADRILASLLFGGLPSGASFEKAVECLQTAIALRPDYCAYRHDLAYFYEKNGNPEKASQMYREVIDIAPKAPEDRVFIEKARARLAALRQSQTNNLPAER